MNLFKKMWKKHLKFVNEHYYKFLTSSLLLKGFGYIRVWRIWEMEIFRKWDLLLESQWDWYLKRKSLIFTVIWNNKWVILTTAEKYLWKRSNFLKRIGKYGISIRNLKKNLVKKRERDKFYGKLYNLIILSTFSSCGNS